MNKDLAEIKRNKKKVYMRKWREQNKNKKKYKENKIKYQKEFKKKYAEKVKLIQKKYDKKKIYCKFCNCRLHPRIKNQHIKTKKHKRNLLNFTKLIKNFLFNKKKISFDLSN